MITIEVAVLAPLPGPYTYEVPPALAAQVRVGSRVWVPMRERRLEGVVLHVTPDAAPGQGQGNIQSLRAILQVVDAPPLPQDLLQTARFIADYYLVPHGEALRLILPTPASARGAAKVALTEAGAEMAGKLGAALVPQDAAALAPVEQELLLGLARLCQRGRPAAAPRLREALSGRGAAEIAAGLARLAEAGLVAQDEEVQAGVKVLHETIVAPVVAPPGSPSPAQALGRSRVRAALLAALNEQGPLSLPVLSKINPRAAEHVKALAAAGLVTVHRREVVRDALGQRWADAPPSIAAAAPLRLTEAQDAVLRALLLGLDRCPGAGEPGDPPAFLLHGVTGSGKTEIYLQLIAEVLRRGRTALVLVPEIGLTPQLAARFRARFGPDVAVLHSGLSAGERADSWRHLAHGELRIALGPRSALFAPLSRLGAVIVDEEHDPSFKQQDGVRYQGRDVALVRARAAGALTVLGSATPSLETLALVEAGKLTKLRLPGRATGSPLPPVRVLDLKQHLIGPEDGLISGPLANALTEVLARKEQAILFLNRRGYATFLLCKGCGHRFQCRHCAVTLTWHKGREDLICHYCGYIEELPERCPQCLARSIERLGLGTQRIEEQIAARFPGARVGRLDRDSAAGAGLHAVLLSMHRREIDILIGTQMLAKGHDFPYVTLVGVVLADTGISQPDFRASERTFQLLSQVAGRAGRAERPGTVLIQTFSPSHPAVRHACTHDFDAFAAEELAARRELGFPPYARMAAVRVDGVDPMLVQQVAREVAARVRQVLARAPQEAMASVLGPAAAPLSRLKGRTRWQMLVRARNSRALHTLLRAALAAEVPKLVRLSVDVDPVSTL
jgi:primosomal protein N' (replication factor Y)